MRFRGKHRDSAAAAEGRKSSQEGPEFAEALSAYRSAIHHMAERRAAQPWVPERRKARKIRLNFVEVPAIVVTILVGVFLPVWSHTHRHTARTSGVASATPRQVLENPAKARPGIDDAMLLSQIDSAVSEDVPEALRPLEVGGPGVTDNSVSRRETR